MIRSRSDWWLILRGRAVATRRRWIISRAEERGDWLTVDLWSRLLEACVIYRYASSPWNRACWRWWTKNFPPTFSCTLFAETFFDRVVIKWLYCEKRCHADLGRLWSAIRAQSFTVYHLLELTEPNCPIFRISTVLPALKVAHSYEAIMRNQRFISALYGKWIKK